MEVRDRWKKNDRELRLALLSSGLVTDPADLFDEFKEIVTDDEAELAGDEVSTKYVFSDARNERTPQQIEEEIAQMLAAASNGTASFADPSYEGWL